MNFFRISDTSHFSPTILSQVSDHDGRFLGLDLELDSRSLSICSIYAPDQDKPKEQLASFNGIQELIEELKGPNLVLGGDFTLNPKMNKSTPETATDLGGAAHTRIETLKEEFDLNDVWCIRYPKKKGFTFSRGSYASRLDYS